MVNIIPVYLSLNLVMRLLIFCKEDMMIHFPMYNYGMRRLDLQVQYNVVSEMRISSAQQYSLV